MTSAEPQQLPDRELLERLEELVKCERAVLVEVVAHLGEVDARKLYLEEACPSMFAYCVERLHFSEAAAYRRICVARLARRLPVVLERLRGGELHLSGLAVLAAHLTPENHLELLAEARHKSKRAIEALVAELRPKPEVRERVCRLPAAKPPGSSPVPEQDQRTFADAPTAAESQPPPAAPPSPTGTREEPLGDQRYRLHLTLPGHTYEKLQEARALMRHQFPDGDLAAVMDRALTLLLEEVKQRRFGLTDRPRRRRNTGKPDGAPISRHVPAEVRRQVFKRDEGRCTYVDAQGRRCEAKEFLEFHHLDPWARGRCHEADRIVLMCRAHNQRAAEDDYGRGFMGEKRQGVDLSPGRGHSGRWNPHEARVEARATAQTPRTESPSAGGRPGARRS